MPILSFLMDSDIRYDASDYFQTPTGRPLSNIWVCNVWPQGSCSPGERMHERMNGALRHFSALLKLNRAP